jgi:hypothetical protein
MTTQSIIDSVRRKILETGTEIISAATLLEYINLAYQDVYKRIYPNSSITTATITCTAGICTLPTDFGTLYGEAYDTSNNNYEEVSIADFKRGEFERAVTIENATLNVLPLTTASLSIKYYPKPVTLTAVVDPTIDDFFHEALVYGATYRCQEDLQDENLAQYYRALFKTELADRLEALSVYEETNQRGGVFFTEQSLVSDNQPYASF